jgi:acyl-coenzyme A thioesterase 13
MTTADAGLPAGFEPLFRTSPFLERTGPFYVKGRGAQLRIGLRVQEHHLNGRGQLHGGMLMTMADIALGYAMSTSTEPPLNAVTSSMSVDFAGGARVGDWVESAVDIQKLGRTLAFANVYLSVGDQRIVRASGIFAVVQKPE